MILLRGTGLAAVLLLALALPAATEKRLDEGAEEQQRPVRYLVSLDVKDAEAAVILKDLQKQCRIRNLMIDPDVKGKGTFYFQDVPCRRAWSVVLRSLGLEAAVYSDAITHVSAGRR